MMDEVANCVHLLGEVKNALRENPSKFQENLQNLGKFLSSLNQDPSSLKALSSDRNVWSGIKEVLTLELKKGDNDTEAAELRLLRGVVILARNLITVIDGVQYCDELQIRDAIFQLMQKIHEMRLEDDVPSIVTNVNVSLFQFLYNFSVCDKGQKKADNTSSMSNIVKFIGYNENWNDELLYTFFMYLSELFDNSDFLYIGLSLGEGKVVFGFLLSHFEKIDLKKEEFSSLELLVISIFQKLILHESFLKFITIHNDEELTIRYYKVAEAIITSKSTWEVFELTVLLSWNYELFQSTSAEVHQYFKVHEDGKDPVFIYEMISRVLDVLSTLVHFEHSRKFLLSYGAVEGLVELLGVLHQNIKAKRLKDTEKTKALENGIVEYKAFPHTKSMIIEILNALIYQNFEVQEKMREIHGLELILSNCIIDDNEPFIKERSIVCLRFLLLENEKNQAFVGKLEARQAVEDETLDEAGYEVEIVDGKVKLRPKPKVEEVK